MNQTIALFFAVFNTLFLLLNVFGTADALDQLIKRGYRKRSSAKKRIVSWLSLVITPTALVVFQLLNGYAVAPAIQAVLILILITLNFAAKKYPFEEEIKSKTGCIKNIVKHTAVTK